MGDERDQDVQRTPLWPPEPEPEQRQPTAEPTDTAASPPAPSQQPPMAHHWTPAPHAWPDPTHQPPEPPGAPATQQQWPSADLPWEAPQPDAATPPLSDEPTMRISAAPAPTVSDAQTMHISAAPPATPPAAPGSESAFAPTPRLEADDAPTERVSAVPVMPPTPSATSASGAGASAPPEPTAPPAGPLLIPRKRKQKDSSLAWRLGVTLFVAALLLAGAGGLYAYASSLAAAPKQIMASYCAALTHDDYRAAYRLLSSSAQAQQTETQYVADAAVRDTIEGRVTACSTTQTQNLSPLSFLRSPRSLIFNAQITRKQAATGQIALSRDAQGWHVAALSSPLQGIDLGPLYTEQALCKALSQRAYTQAYALLSSPYQQEQGNASTFARAFGDTLAVTGCAPNLKTYSVNSADQQASLDATLTLSVASSTSGSAPSVFSLPARLAFVREATGWRVDAITPLLNQ